MTLLFASVNLNVHKKNIANHMRVHIYGHVAKHMCVGMAISNYTTRPI